MKQHLDLFCEHAKEKANAPHNWDVFSWACHPTDGTEVIYYQIKGAVCEAVKTRGPNKGQKDWSKRDRSTERTVNITVREHSEWKQQWSARTGKCNRCTGTGETLLRMSVDDGALYKPCPKCLGTGTNESIFIQVG